MMNYYLISGEASGDLHASHLMQALKERDSQADFRFYGGEKMATVGGTLVRHYKKLAYMGVIPVLMHLNTILDGIRECERDILAWKPDILILVDYPGFNLKIAAFINKYYRSHPQEKRPNIIYYISPKIWAWKEGRIKYIKRDVDHVLSILPFEVDWYQNKHGYHVDYVGNPTLDEIDVFQRKHPIDHKLFRQQHDLDSRPIIALLAGSRMQEIEGNLGRMLIAVEPFVDEYQIVLAAAPNIERAVYDNIISHHNVTPIIITSDTFSILQHSTAALVTSGTATLETAIFGVPQVVCYWMRMGWFVSRVRPYFLKIPFISLVNLIAGREVVPELVANDMTAMNISHHLATILPGGRRRDRILEGYRDMMHKLGTPGASLKAAEKMAHLQNPVIDS